MEMKLPRPLKNTNPFNHLNLERFFNHSKDNNLIHQNYENFMDFYAITASEKSHAVLAYTTESSSSRMSYVDS